MLKQLDTKNWSREDILREANLQAGAIARLSTWKRIAYSTAAIGIILGLWGSSHNIQAAQVIGGVCIVVGLLASGVLYVGVRRAKENVERMLEVAGIDPKELVKPRSKKDVEHRQQAK